MVLVKQPAPSLNKSWKAGAGLCMAKGAPIMMRGAKNLRKTKTSALKTAVRPIAATRICAMQQRCLWQASSSFWHAY